jgi:hypothetical protein
MRIQEHRVNSIDVDECRVRQGLMEVCAVSVAHELGCAPPAVTSQE